MRETKFRGRRIDSGRWVYGDYFKTPLTDENSGTKPEAGWFFLTGEIRHCIGQDGTAFVIDVKTLGEFAGQHDKNMTEIYEGDIVEWRSGLDRTKARPRDYGQLRIGSVYFASESGYWRVNENAKSIHHLLVDAVNANCEVIGNIHESPELLQPASGGERG